MVSTFPYQIPESLASKMSPSFWIVTLSILSTVSSMPTGSGQDMIQLIQVASEPLPWTIGSSLQSLPPLSSTTLSRGNVIYDCDKRPFSLGPRECREAWRQIPRFDGKQYSIGNRSADQKWDIPLPMRWPSGKRIDHARDARLLMYQ